MGSLGSKMRERKSAHQRRRSADKDANAGVRKKVVADSKPQCKNIFC